jgi:hypothetical protein
MDTNLLFVYQMHYSKKRVLAWFQQQLQLAHCTANAFSAAIEVTVPASLLHYSTLRTAVLPTQLVCMACRATCSVQVKPLLPPSPETSHTTPKHQTTTKWQERLMPWGAPHGSQRVVLSLLAS